jgi:hypothetical protein
MRLFLAIPLYPSASNPEADTQAVRRNLCSARRSAITCVKVANSESERCRRRGKTRQVMKNQQSDSTRRRSRDMRVIITVGSTKSRRGTQKPRTSALPALLIVGVAPFGS